MLNPDHDGIDHINIYSKAKTELGRFLTNFSRSPITTEDGYFESIEGYWYWLGTDHKDRDKLRKLSGFKAKQIGRELKALDWQDSDDFKRKICEAITYKIKNSKYYDEFKQSTLPFCHYYNYHGKIVEPEDGKWVIEHMEKLRKEKELEYASIESKEDLNNFLDYIKEGSFDVDIEEPYIYAENYKIEVKSGFEHIYDEIEKVFNPKTEIEWNHAPTKILTVEGYNFNLY